MRITTLIASAIIVLATSSGSASAADERLLIFEIGAEAFALPVDGVLEVVDMGEMACIPTIPPEIAGVVNTHGDALAVVHRSKLLRLGESSSTRLQQILVITDRVTETARFGLPVDRVVGLVPAHGEMVQGSDPVVERVEISGRETSVLDPRQLVERAKELIENSASGVE